MSTQSGKGGKGGKKGKTKKKKVVRGEPIALPPLRDDGVDGESFGEYVAHAREGLDSRLGMITTSLERSRKAREAAEKKRRAREKKAARKKRQGRGESGEWRMTLASLSLPLHQTQPSALRDPSVLLPSAVESQSAHDAAMARARESIASLYKSTRRGTSKLPPPDILAEPIVFQPSWTSKPASEGGRGNGNEAETDSALNDHHHQEKGKGKRKGQSGKGKEEWVPAPKLDLDDIVFEPVEYPPLSITPPPMSRRALVSGVGNELSPELRVATGWAPIRPSVASLAPYARSPYDLDIHFRSSKFT